MKKKIKKLKNLILFLTDGEKEEQNIGEQLQYHHRLPARSPHSQCGKIGAAPIGGSKITVNQPTWVTVCKTD